MDRITLSKLLNFFLSSIAVVILSFALSRSYFGAKAALFVSIFATIIVMTAVWIVENERERKSGIKSKDANHAHDVMSALYTAPSNIVDLFFLKAIQKTTPCKLQNGWIETSTKTIACFFDSKQTSINEITKKMQKLDNKNKKIVAFGINFEDEAKRLNIQLVSAAEVYNFLKQQKIFPKITQKTKRKKTNLLRTAISRKNFKRYFLLAIVFSFSAMIVPYKKLYFAFSIITTILALFSLFAKKESQPTFLLE